MGKTSKIEWTDATFNPWVGCTKVSPGCDHCYAEGWAKRSGLVKWGETRRRTSPATWKEPLTLEREAAAAGVRKRVFCASLADVFDNQVPDEWREDLFRLILRTPHLDWLLLTKRIGNVKAMLPADWGDGFPNVWLGISIVNQEEADRDIAKLLKIPARIRFLSCEPLLEAVDLTRWLVDGPRTIEWVICGGESGAHARPMQIEWALTMKEDCRREGVAFFMKQGSKTAAWPDFDNIATFPQRLQVREWPV
jgi:protein gp37